MIITTNKHFIAKQSYNGNAVPANFTQDAAWHAADTTNARLTFVAPLTGTYRISANFSVYLYSAGAWSERVSFGLSIDAGANIIGKQALYDCGLAGEAHIRTIALVETVTLTAGVTYNLDLFVNDSNYSTASSRRLQYGDATYDFYDASIQILAELI